MISNILKVLRLKLAYFATTRLIRQLLVLTSTDLYNYLDNNTSTEPAAILSGNLVGGDTT